MRARRTRDQYPERDKTGLKDVALVAWVILVISGVLEAVWATALGKTEGFTKLWPSLLFGVTLMLSMGGLALAMREIPTGTAYVVWVGIGAALTVGYAMQAGAVKHGPFAGLEYQNVNVDSYTQKGVFPISVSGYDVDSLRLIAGYRVEGSYDRFTPYASVAYAHEFDDNSINTSATLLGGSKFRLSGGGLGSSILISVGTNYAFTPALSMNVGYQGEISVESEGTDSNGASIGLNYGF